MKDKKEDNIRLTELFMGKCGNDWSRCFMGTIQRLHDENGVPYCYGKINVKTGWVCARASHQEALGRKLDELVLWILDYGLHDECGKSLSIADTSVFLN